MQRPRLAPGHRLLAVFALTIFAPGMLLAFFGAQNLWQERERINDRLRERLEYSAGIAVDSLSEQLARLQSRVDQKAWSNGAHLDWPDDGSWAFVVREEDGLRVYPPRVLPFELQAIESGTPEPLLPSPAQVKYREARALKEAGRLDDARRLWRDIEKGGGWIGAVPADLIAGFELAKDDPAGAQQFYNRLASGQWRIDKARYLFYSDQIIERVAKNEREEAALRLADAVEAVVAGARVVTSENGAHVAFRRDSPFAALVVSDRFLASRVAPAADAEAKVARIVADGRVVFGEPGRARSGQRATRTLNAAGISWGVDVEPKDAAGFVAASMQRSNLYLAMLQVVLALLAVGGYLVTRTVRREMEVARQKSDFVSTVSHEFRSPLTGIRQLAEMLSRDRILDEGKRQQYYDLILRESERLGRLVESVLDFARMEDGRKRYRFEPLDTTAWLRGVAKEFEGDAARAGFALDASIPDDLPRVNGDPDALATAVHNLLDNAVKYSPGSKTVWLDAQEVGGRVRIRVRDRGVGIPTRQQSQIFEKFYRVDGELSKQVKGVGLGLSLVRHVVESHHGTVSVESREGEGSTFAIDLLRAT